MSVNIKIKPRKIELSDRFKKYSNLLPESCNNVERVDIKLKGEICVLNAIRRTLIGEMNVYALYAPLNKIENTGYIVVDCIATRLRLMPISQNYNNLIGELHVINNSLTPVTVTTDDIQFKVNNKQVKTSLIVDPTYRLEKLMPNQELHINDISCIMQAGYEDNGESTMISNINYEIDTTNNLSFDTLGVIPAKTLLTMCMENIIHRLKVILEFIKDVKETKTSDTIDLILGTYCELIIKNESYTIGELIQRFTYQIDNSIAAINYSNSTPLLREITIRWSHSTKVDIIVEGIKAAIKEFEKIQQAI